MIGRAGHRELLLTGGGTSSDGDDARAVEAILAVFAVLTISTGRTLRAGRTDGALDSSGTGRTNSTGSTRVASVTLQVQRDPELR